MKNDWIHILWLSAAFLALFGTAEFLYHVLKVKAEISRKFVHLFTGVLTLLFPLFLQNHWSVLILCVSFAVILLLSLRFGFLPSINAIDRPSLGSLLYPLAVYLAFLFYVYNYHQQVYFYLPILTLAVCDPMAALLGKRFPYGKFKVGCGHKTILGCTAFLLTSIVLTLFLLMNSESIAFNRENFLLTSVLVAISSTIAEAFSGKGWDNLTIPLTVMGVMLLI